jgi:hypothetical protein
MARIRVFSNGGFQLGHDSLEFVHQAIRLAAAEFL